MSATFCDNQILDRNSQTTVRPNLVAVLLFATRIAEDLVVNIIRSSSKANKSYSQSKSYSYKSNLKVSMIRI